jgi:hypothetical protein
VLGKEHLDTTGEHEQHGNRCLATDAEGSQGNYEHGEEMHGSYLLATSSKAITGNISGLLFSLDILFRLGQLLDRNVAVLEEDKQHWPQLHSLNVPSVDVEVFEDNVLAEDPILDDFEQVFHLVGDELSHRDANCCKSVRETGNKRQASETHKWSQALPGCTLWFLGPKGIPAPTRQY